MSKLIKVLLVCLLGFGLCACSSKRDNTEILEDMEGNSWKFNNYRNSMITVSNDELNKGFGYVIDENTIVFDEDYEDRENAVYVLTEGKYYNSETFEENSNISSEVEKILSDEKLELEEFLNFLKWYSENYKVEIPKVKMEDLSKLDAAKWCSEHNLTFKKETEYSSSVKNGGFIKQSVAVGEEIEEGSEVVVTYSLGKEPTIGEKNAVKKAESYLRSSSFSKKGLIEQLEFEGFSNAEAKYAVEHIEVDWKEQAVKKAASYLRSSSFSKSGLIEQLKFEGFTSEKAKYGVEKNGY